MQEQEKPHNKAKQFILYVLTDVVGRVVDSGCTDIPYEHPGCTDDDVIGTDSLSASVGDRVEPQKLHLAHP